MIITLVVLILFFAEGDLQTFYLAIYVPILYLINKRYPSFSIYFDLIMNVIIGITFSQDQITLDSNKYKPHIRAYIYVASVFCISINTSMNWFKSTIAFGLSNLIISYRIQKHFKQVSPDYTPVILSTIITFGISLYWVESFQRKIYMMYLNVKKLKKKYSTILNLYPESIAIINFKKRQIKYFNQSFAQVFDCDVDKNWMIKRKQIKEQEEGEIQRIKIYYIDSRHQKQKSEIIELQSIWDIIQLINKSSNSQSIHFRILKNKESENTPSVQQEKKKIFYEVCSRKIDNNKDTYMIIFKNITKLKECEKNKKFRKINKIAYYQVTHEILTPINTLISMIQILRQKLSNTNPDIKEIIELSYNTTNKMLRTVLLYTDFQMLHEGSLTRQIQPLNIVKWIEEVYQSYRNETSLKKLNFQLNVDKDLLKSDGIINNDKQRLTQIIQIIIDNAIKFTSFGSIIINVIALVRSQMLDQSKQKIKIQIIDTGCGIDEEKQDSLFSIFETAKFQKKVNDGGAGLGLAFCKKMAHLISVDISYSSIKGQGTTVTLEISDLKNQNQKLIKGRYESLKKQNLLNDLTNNNDCQNTLFHSDCLRNLQTISLSPLDKFHNNNQNYDSFNDDDLSEENPTIPEIGKYKNSQNLTVISFDQFMRHQNHSFTDIASEIVEGLDTNQIKFSNSAFTIQKPEILIVDDDAFSVFSLQQVLKDIFNLKSDTSYSGKEAIFAIQKRQSLPGARQYKLVFMDLNMPELNGLETLKIIKSQGEENKINIDGTAFILYSCLSNTIDLSELRQEFDDVIYKPIDISNLRELLTKYNMIR